MGLNYETNSGHRIHDTVYLPNFDTIPDIIILIAKYLTGLSWGEL